MRCNHMQEGGSMEKPEGRNLATPGALSIYHATDPRNSQQSCSKYPFKDSQPNYNSILASGCAKVRVWLILSSHSTVNHKPPVIMMGRWKLQDDRPSRIQQVTAYRGNNNGVYLQGGLAIEFDILFLRNTSIPGRGTFSSRRGNLVVAGVSDALLSTVS